MEGEQNPTEPFEIPFFTISSHELYGVASKLIQSDGDKRFFDSIFEEIQKIHKEEEKEEEVRGGLGGWLDREGGDAEGEHIDFRPNACVVRFRYSISSSRSLTTFPT